MEGHRLVVGTGNGALPVMKRCGPRLSVAKVKLLIVRTEQAIELLKQNPPDTNAILHVTC